MRAKVEGEIARNHEGRQSVDQVAYGVVTSWVSQIDAIRKKLARGTDFHHNVEAPLDLYHKIGLEDHLLILVDKIDKPFPTGRSARRSFRRNGHLGREARMALERHTVLLRPTHGRASLPHRV